MIYEMRFSAALMRESRYIIHINYLTDFRALYNSWTHWLSSLTARYAHGARLAAYLLTAALNVLLLTFICQVLLTT